MNSNLIASKPDSASRSSGRSVNHDFSASYRSRGRGEAIDHVAGIAAVESRIEADAVAPRRTVITFEKVVGVTMLVKPAPFIAVKPQSAIEIGAAVKLNIEPEVGLPSTTAHISWSCACRCGNWCAA